MNRNNYENLYHLAHWSSAMEFWSARCFATGRCISSNCPFLFKYNIKKIYSLIIILKKNKYFGNKKLLLI